MTPSRAILVTGAAGFIGSAFANLAVARYPDDTFVLLDSLTTVSDINNLDTHTLNSTNSVFEKVDIRDSKELDRVFKEHNITDVIHFAAESHVDVSINDPAIFVATNVTGTLNLLMCSHRYHIHRFHQISTDEVYGTLQIGESPFSETSLLLPNNPYSASKASADLLVRSYHQTFGMDTVITRSSNNYGPRQDRTKLIPLFTTALLTGGQVPLYGTGLNTRDWLYVGDNVEAIDLVFRTGISGEIYNVGGNCERSNIEITRALLTLTGRGEDAITFVSDRLGHDLRYALSSEKVHSLGWHPKTSLEDGLATTVTYYRERLNH